MSTRLRQLILPQLVEERRQLDDSQTPLEPSEPVFGFLADNTSSSDIASPATPTFSHRSAFGHLRYSSSSSSIDLVLPSPPAAECSLPPAPAVGNIGDVVAVPSAPLSISHASGPAPRRSLPDVQEEDAFERDEAEYGFYEAHDEDFATFPEAPDLYGCLCDEPCSHGREDSISRSFDTDRGFISDSDTGIRRSFSRRRRGRGRGESRGGSISTLGQDGSLTESAFSHLTQRLGIRIHALSRLRSGSTSRSRTNTLNSLAGAPASEPALSTAMSYAPSSRSSSTSSHAQRTRRGEMPLAPTPSYYGSTDSLALVAPIPTSSSVYTASDCDVLDLEDDDVRQNLERDRRKATTPLLPPIAFGCVPPPAATLSLPPSLHASPTVASPAGGMFSDPFTLVPSLGVSATASPVPSDVSVFSGPPASIGGHSAAVSHLSTADTLASPSLPSPPLSSKLSESSFRPPLRKMDAISVCGTGTLMATPGSVPSSALSTPTFELQETLELQDAWSDRLGHANYVIFPRPYLPAEASQESLEAFRTAWSQARINYAKHVVRVGEHYGLTSNTYVLTEAKWAETEREWRDAHTALVGSGDHYAMDAWDMRLPDDVSAVVPRLLDREGKFPDIGDEDIVGPMARATPVAYALDDQHGSRRFWRSLAGKVGLRK